jgi:hypothetical protein
MVRTSIDGMVMSLAKTPDDEGFTGAEATAAR